MNVPSFHFEEISDYHEAIKIIDIDFVNNRIYEAILYGIDNYLLNVYLYDLNLKDGVTYSVKCPRIKWEELLIEAKDYFEDKEEYEKCAAINKMIAKLNSGDYI